MDNIIYYFDYKRILTITAGCRQIRNFLNMYDVDHVTRILKTDLILMFLHFFNFNYCKNRNFNMFIYINLTLICSFNLSKNLDKSIRIIISRQIQIFWKNSYHFTRSTGTLEFRYVLEHVPKL